MKKLFLTLSLLLGLCSSASAQTDFLDKFLNLHGENVTVFNISSEMFDLMGNEALDMTGYGVGKLEGNLHGLTVIQVDDNITVVNELKEALEQAVKSGYVTLMSMSDSGEDMKMYLKKDPTTGDVLEMLMVTSFSQEMNVIRLKGNFTSRDMKNLVNQM